MKRNSVTKYFAGLRASGHYKAEIRRDMSTRLKAKGLWVGQHPLSQLNPAKREILHDCIFAVEDRLESRGGGQPDHPAVVALRTARNRVLDDLGWNEAPPSKLGQPEVRHG
jgi:hypothetical protein